MHWLVKENSSLKGPEDFEKFVKDNGRKVKVGVLATGVCADLETNAWLRKNNITPNDTIEYVTLPDNQQEQALLQGDIDIATLHPPFFCKSRKR